MVKPGLQLVNSKCGGLCSPAQHRSVTVGVSGRDQDKLDPVSLWRGNLSLHGVVTPALLDNENARIHGNAQPLLEHVATGVSMVGIDKMFPLQEAQTAHAYVMSRQAFGRVSLFPSTDTAWLLLCKREPCHVV